MDETTPRRRPARRVLATVLGGGVVLGIAGVGVAAFGIGGQDADRPARADLPPATRKLAKTTLVETLTADGSLSYGEPRPLTGKAAGTITWLPAVGTKIGRGGTAYRVDDRPVPLLCGPLPLYRPLKTGVKGADVRQFEGNLRAMGYKGFTVDDSFTAPTAAAVKKWQKALGLPETGEITPGMAVLAPGEIRVAEPKARVGDAAGAEIYTFTGTSRLVTLSLDSGDQHLAKPGAPVSVELPGGETAQGKIASVGDGVTAGNGQDGGKSEDSGNQGGEAKVKVLVTVKDQKALGAYALASVTVRLEAEKRENVLAVPVAALLALAEGGYGVQVVERGSTRIVPVKLGLFADGKVEVTGPGLAEGITVGVPA